MNNLEKLFAGKKGGLFMAHMIAGCPTMEESEKVAEALVKGGADIIELQIPFSDPMADGPAIAVASEEAIKGGATVAKSLALLEKVARLGKPVAVMTYLNIPFRYGISKFVTKIAKTGASALIVPDCPFDTEEGRELLTACKETQVYLIPVVSPGVPKERLEQLATDASGFVYCTSRQGITGANSKFAKELVDFVKELKEIFKLPIAVGFGVKSKEDVAELAKVADIVIAGSFFIHVIKTSSPGSVEKSLKSLIS
ncbi:MAG: tryptophan synthase subunit alpha [Candidatus Kaiserbacteria bacterium]|nr:tryptophan synthase subunit alpha [Candidatus Kaiserbacteria bacterium]